jgi:hypothetical protein
LRSERAEDRSGAVSAGTGQGTGTGTRSIGKGDVTVMDRSAHKCQRHMQRR